jgi:hypothetical protein
MKILILLLLLPVLANGQEIEILEEADSSTVKSLESETTAASAEEEATTSQDINQKSGKSTSTNTDFLPSGYEVFNRPLKLPSDM